MVAWGQPDTAYVLDKAFYEFVEVGWKQTGR